MSKPKNEEPVDLDSILKELGTFGKYQVTTYALIALPILFSAIYASQYIFMAGALDYRCKVPQCEQEPPQYAAGDWAPWALPQGGGGCEQMVPLDGKCTASSFHRNQTQKCTSWVYDGDNSIVAEFDLACHDWKRTLVGTIRNAGVFAALGITAAISDTFGRKIAFIGTAVLSGVVGVIRAFSGSYPVYVTLEFVEATLGAGVYSSGFILAVEMVGLDRRVLGGNIVSSTFAMGQVLLALTAWAFPYWRTLTLLIYAPAMFFILYCFVIEESVRWLLSKGKKKEAARIIFKAAAINKKKLSPASIKMLTEEPAPVKPPHPPPATATTHDSGRAKEEPRRLSMAREPEPEQNLSVFMQVLKSRTLVSRVFICSFWWITLTFIYYGLSINSVSLAGNMYVNYILTSLVEIPGYFISIVTLDRYGRKRSIIVAFFICGTALITLPFVPAELSWLQITLNLIGKLCISMAFSSIYLYTSELFPTEVRHSLLGTCSMVGRVGSLLAPQTPLLMAYMESLPYLIFGVMAAVSGLLMLLTPETLRTRLPDTIAQAENIHAGPRNTSSRTIAE